ncbi:MAG: two pore domain potassium channel family protein [Nitrospirae bacterium]|nr:two pore domain potassium channel family protein [Nitrospirota bacterium]
MDKDQPEEAFKLFDEAASLYKRVGDHYNSAECFASAGTCWNIHSGEKALFNAASRYQYAGEEAMKCYHYEYARGLYHDASRIYERDGYPKWFSLCFYMSKICEGKHAWLVFSNSAKLKTIPGVSYSGSFKSRFKYFFNWLLNEFHYLIWGYGEKPYRALLTVLSIILLSSIIFYTSGVLVYKDKVIPPTFFDSLYFSIVTFTTLGYGDYQPVGIYRLVSMIEAFSALFIMPLFVVALTRKYLRTYY